MDASPLYRTLQQDRSDRAVRQVQGVHGLHRYQELPVSQAHPGTRQEALSPNVKAFPYIIDYIFHILLIYRIIYIYIFQIVNSYRRDGTSSSSLTLICQHYSALFISKIRKRILKMEIQERQKKKICGATARKAVLFPHKWKMTKSRDAQNQSLDPIFSCQDWVVVEFQMCQMTPSMKLLWLIWYIWSV